MTRRESAAGVKSKNLSWQEGGVTASDRARLLAQRGCVVWLTGLSGSGKSTLAQALEKRLMERGHACYVLDGDNVRHGLNRDLGFSPEDRQENIRRVGEVAALMADAGLITIAAFISPYRSGRRGAREACGRRPFVEVFLDASLEICQQRDPKGLYARARSGKVKQFTGVSAPYEPPRRAEITLDSGHLGVRECADTVLAHLEAKGIFQNNSRVPRLRCLQPCLGPWSCTAAEGRSRGTRR